MVPNNNTSTQSSGLLYPIPNNAKNAFLGLGRDSVSNPGLLFDRYLGFASGWKMGEEKKNNLQKVIAASKKIDEGLLNANLARWKAMVAAQNGISFKMESTWRFVTGMGRKGSLEVGFAFDRYGFPILPGSGLKGLARMRGLMALAERVGCPSLIELSKVLEEPDGKKSKAGWKEFDPDLKLIDKAIAFRRIFGTQTRAGSVWFFDAVPEAPLQLKMDVMTPHFPKYYQIIEAPTDNQNPNPIPFLTVEKAVFWFGLTCTAPDEEDRKEYFDRAIDWLKYGLRDLGAGAKTNAGYGFFEPV